VADLKAGDLVEVNVEGLTPLRNTVVALDGQPFALAQSPSTKAI
jgi:hypothetical protein